MGNHSPTAGMPAASTLSEPTPKALVWGQENRRGSSSTKLLSSLTRPDKGPNDGSDQMQCCESGNHINYWNEQQSNTQSHVLHCWKNCLELILSTLLQKKLLCEQKSYQHSYKKSYCVNRKEKQKPMNSGTSWHTSYLPIIVVRSLSCSVTSLCDPVDCSTPGRSVLHCLPEFAQILSIKSVMLRPSHPLSPLLHSPQSFPASGSFPARQFFISGGQSIRASASASVLPVNIQG